MNITLELRNLEIDWVPFSVSYSFFLIWFPDYWPQYHQFLPKPLPNRPDLSVPYFSSSAAVVAAVGSASSLNLRTACSPCCWSGFVWPVGIWSARWCQFGGREAGKLEQFLDIFCKTRQIHQLHPTCPKNKQNYKYYDHVNERTSDCTNHWPRGTCTWAWCAVSESGHCKNEKCQMNTSKVSPHLSAHFVVPPVHQRPSMAFRWPFDALLLLPHINEIPDQWIW